MQARLQNVYQVLCSSAFLPLTFGLGAVLRLLKRDGERLRVFTGVLKVTAVSTVPCLPQHVMCCPYG